MFIIEAKLRLVTEHLAAKTLNSPGQDSVVHIHTHILKLIKSFVLNLSDKV